MGNARKREPNVIIPRMLGIEELCAYVGLGKAYARQFGVEAGAMRKVGKRILFDRKAIDAALDQMESEVAL